MKSKLPWLLVASLALLLIAFVAFHRARTTNLHRQLQDLRAELLCAHDARLQSDQTRDILSASADKLRAELAELPRLRADLTRARQELAARPSQTIHETNAPAARDSAPNSLAPTSTPRAFGAELSDLGAATPERAASSLVWAAATGNRDRLADLLELPQGIPESEIPQHHEHFANLLSNKFSQIELTEINNIAPTPDGRLRLNIQYRDLATGQTNPFPFFLRRHLNGWRIVVED